MAPDEDNPYEDAPEDKFDNPYDDADDSQASDDTWIDDTVEASDIEIVQYTGNPTQAHMPPPLSGRRHIVLTAQCSPTWLISIACQDSPFRTDQAGADPITYLEDVTNDGAIVSSQQQSHPFRLYYAQSVANFPTTLPHYREYDITFASSHVEHLRILVPGFGGQYNLPMGSSSLTMHTYACFAPSGFQYPGHFAWWDLTGNTTGTPIDIYYTAYTRGVLDPNNIFPNYASAFLLNTHLVRRDDACQVIINNLLNINGITKSWFVGDNTAAKQVFEVVVDLSTSSSPHYLSIQSAVGAGTYNIPFANEIGQYESGTIVSPIASAVIYSENLPDCIPTMFNIDACTDINNMAYWGYQSGSPNYLQCDGTTIIPSSVVTTPSTATWGPGTCCPDCINVNADDISYSTQPLTLSAQVTDPTTIG